MNQSSVFTSLIVCILVMNMSGMSNFVFGMDSSADPISNLPSISADLEQNVKILTMSGTDKSGNNFQVDLVLNKDLMGMHQMMMQHMSMMHGMMNMSGMGGMSMMGGMGHMGGMMNSSSMNGMSGMQSGNTNGMFGMQSGNMGGMMNNMMQSCPCMQMMKVMQNQYVVEGGVITISSSGFLSGPSTYEIDSGIARIIDDKVFLNAHAGTLDAGKIIIVGKLNQDDALKGFLLLPDAKTFVKITGKGSFEDPFQ